MPNWIERALSPEDQKRWEELQANWGNANYIPTGRGSTSLGLAPRVDEEFVGTSIGPGPQGLSDLPPEPTNAVDAWHAYDQARAPGGLFYGQSPTKLAEMEANLILQYGDRPLPPDPYAVLRQRVEQKYSLVADVDEGMAKLLDAQLNAIPTEEIAFYQERARNELGPERYTLAMQSARKILGDEEMRDGRVSANAYALKVLHSVDIARTRMEAELAALPKRQVR